MIKTLSILISVLIQVGAYSTHNDMVLLITTSLILLGGIILSFIKRYNQIGIGLLICSGLNLLAAIGLFIMVSNLH